MVTLIKTDAAKVVDLGTKVITKYTSPDKEMEINHMKISGRHPENPDQFIYETDVRFMVYILKGKAKIWCDEEIFELDEGDVIDIPPKTRYAVDGQDLEYITFEHPAWFPEQASIVDALGNKIEDTTK